jgi:di/tricarboxylate transporter
VNKNEILAFALIVCTLGMFVWGRFRYDLVALGSLLAGVFLGVIPAKHAFDGFKNDVVVIIATALVVSAAFQRSGVAELVLRPMLDRLKSERTQAPALAAATAVLSMATKNVGALAILMPVAIQLAKRTGTSVSRLLMPMASASLLGGLVTLVGTSPNILVSEVRERTLGRPFNMYDFAPVGLCLTAGGVIFLAFAYRLLPRSRTAEVGVEEVLQASSYVMEAKAPQDWVPRRISRLEEKSKGAVKVTALTHRGGRRDHPPQGAMVEPGDAVVLEGDETALHRLLHHYKLKPLHPEPTRKAAEEKKSSAKAETRTIEAVVGAGSKAVGMQPRRLNMERRFKIHLVAVSRQGRRSVPGIDAAPLRVGDILLLRGLEADLSRALAEIGALPLADRPLQLGAKRPVFLPPLILAAAMILVALKVLPIAIAFFAAAFAVVAVRALPMREAYAALDGPVLVLIAALIPVSEALQSTGGVDLLAHGVSQTFRGAPPIFVLTGLMTAAMLAAPFLHNAPTVLILGPVAVAVAESLHIAPDPLLMGVAVGAACDFLTPVGHQCNTLVMGPGGYRFIDYPRLGAPLSLFVIAVGAPLIAHFWPLRPH